MARTYTATCETCKAKFCAIDKKNKSWPYTEVCNACAQEEHEAKVKDLEAQAERILPSEIDRFEAMVLTMRRCMADLMANAYGGGKSGMNKAELAYMSKLLKVSQEMADNDKKDSEGL